MNGAINIDDYVKLESELVKGYFRVYSLEIAEYSLPVHCAVVGNRHIGIPDFDEIVDNLNLSLAVCAVDRRADMADNPSEYQRKAFSILLQR